MFPAALSNDADYLTCFQHETQALAARHRPNIATIFGLQQDAIVMVLVEGQNAGQSGAPVTPSCTSTQAFPASDPTESGVTAGKGSPFTGPQTGRREQPRFLGGSQGDYHRAYLTRPGT